MAVTDLKGDRMEIITGNDNVVIVDNFQSKRGGCSLDVTGYPKDVINAGHVIIRDTVTGDYKPMPLNGAGTDYDVLPANHEYAGILIASIFKKRAFAGIMVRGTVNYEAAPFSMTTIMAAVKAALPLIYFRKD